MNAFVVLRVISNEDDNIELVMNELLKRSVALRLFALGVSMCF